MWTDTVRIRIRWQQYSINYYIYSTDIGARCVTAHCDLPLKSVMCEFIGKGVKQLGSCKYFRILYFSIYGEFFFYRNIHNSHHMSKCLWLSFKEFSLICSRRCIEGIELDSIFNRDQSWLMTFNIAYRPVQQIVAEFLLTRILSIEQIDVVKNLQ